MDLAIFTEKHQPQPLAWQYHLSYVTSVHYMYRFVSGPFNLIYFSILALKVHLVTGTLIITLDIWRNLLSLATSRFSYSWLLHFHMFQLLGLKKKIRSCWDLVMLNLQINLAHIIDSFISEYCLPLPLFRFSLILILYPLYTKSSIFLWMCT